MYARVRRTLILKISTLFNWLCIHTDDDNNNDDRHIYNSPRNENLNLLVRIKFLNLFLFWYKQKLKNLLVRIKFYWGPEYCCSSWGPIIIIIRTAQFLQLYKMSEDLIQMYNTLMNTYFNGVMWECLWSLVGFFKFWNVCYFVDFFRFNTPVYPNWMKHSSVKKRKESLINLLAYDNKDIYKHRTERMPYF